MGKCDRQKLTAIGAGAVFLMAAQVSAEVCSADSVSVRGAFGEAEFTVTVADDAAERGQGLMFVEQMGPFEGMLFVFARPQPTSFWMRNTLIPLDMIFVGADGVIDKIHENAVPLDETPIFGGEEIMYVLEINGGMSDRLGLTAGDQIRHPQLTGDVVWPCDDN
ncbi:DUF192 domain-containing protein [Pseudooctadecabacter jejudonensis]|uniref:ACR n=1 Tax=Pseudooctadecabacter jejudonensis TaxID=1391910 RepID=A0A1Y5RAS7_9RHOB|nr:DUF192 domain-containing protein [Pseudooctadecabacter jejudonensis]SLN12997.1 hypothetical protein PSJ8397_00201 [Pseudooctadecabacter jejudonensis]